MQIANVTFTKTPYMDEETRHVQMFTVNAYSKEQAEEKIRQHFEDLSEPYVVYFSVLNISFIKHIE